MELPNSDILVKSVDIPLLRKQYEWLLLQVPSYGDYEDELHGLLNLVEYMLESKEKEE